MTTYYLEKHKEKTINSPLEARKIGYNMMKSSKYIYDYVRIFDSDGRMYGEIAKSGDRIDFVTYSKDKKRIYPIKENGEFKNPNLKKPYFYIYNNKTYRFETLTETRKSSLHLDKPKMYPIDTYELSVFKVTKNGTYLYEKLNIKKKGDVYCYIRKSYGFELYKIGKNGNLINVYN